MKNVGKVLLLAILTSCGVDDPASLSMTSTNQSPPEPECSFDMLAPPEGGCNSPDPCFVDCFGNVFPMNTMDWLVVPGGRFYAYYADGPNQPPPTFHSTWAGPAEDGTAEFHRANWVFSPLRILPGNRVFIPINRRLSSRDQISINFETAPMMGWAMRAWADEVPERWRN